MLIQLLKKGLLSGTKERMIITRKTYVRSESPDHNAERVTEGSGHNIQYNGQVNETQRQSFKNELLKQYCR